MRHEHIAQSVAVHIRECGAHVRRRRAHRIEGQPALPRLLGESAVALIDEQSVGPPVVRAKNIRPAVAVEIRTHQAERHAGRAEQAAHFAAILEARRAAGLFRRVMPEPRGRGSEGGGCAKILHALHVMAGLRRVVVHVIPHDEIEPAIAVVIDEARGRGPARIVDPGGARDFLKLSPA